MASVHGEQKYPSVLPHPLSRAWSLHEEELVALARSVRADSNSKPTITAFSNTMRTTELLNSTGIAVES
jgi:hypothetical protein